MVSTTIKCGCGQENQLVCIKNVWRRDVKKHGTDAVYAGKCFNCNNDLDQKPQGYTAPPVKPGAVGEPGGDKETMLGLIAEIEKLQESSGKLISEMDKLRTENEQLRADAQSDDGKEKTVGLEALTIPELRQYAGRNGIELPGGNRSKGELIAAIEDAPAGGEGED